VDKQRIHSPCGAGPILLQFGAGTRRAVGVAVLKKAVDPFYAAGLLVYRTADEAYFPSRAAENKHRHSKRYPDTFHSVLLFENAAVAAAVQRHQKNVLDFCVILFQYLLNVLGAVAAKLQRVFVESAVADDRRLRLVGLFEHAKAAVGLHYAILHVLYCENVLLPKLRQLDDNVAEAAMDLGATPWKALIKVILPQIYPAILSGALIAFSMSFDDFVISYFTAGMDVQNISMYVYSMKRFNPAVNALSAVIVIVVTVILVLANLIPYLRNKKMNKEEQ
jgi:ABC-type spermidine/putrescine transport system permease subunit II